MTMALNSIEKEWQGFATMVFQKMEPTDVQIKEMKKAFFAGAWALFSATEEIGMPHIPEDEACRYLESVRQECIDFKNQIMREYLEA